MTIDRDKKQSSVKIDEENRLIEELEEEESEPVSDTEDNIIRKYDEGQARIIIQRNDFLVPNILQMVRNKSILNLSPTYQRRKRWDFKKKSHLIESLLMNIPIPPIFLYEHDLAKYEVMDGQQRLDAIKTFFNNEFPLSNLVKWPELNNRRFNDLPGRIQQGLHRRGLAAVIILTESGQTTKDAMEIRKYVFERLNTGGEKLNAQEIRNCIYASNFNSLLIELSRTKLFTDAWKIPKKEPNEPHKISKELASNKLYSTMSDCEIVLRYFALSEMDKFTKGMKRTLDECMFRKKKDTKDVCTRYKEEYLRCLRIATSIYGEYLFRLPNRAGKLRGRLSVPLSDAVLLSIKYLGKNAVNLHSIKDKVIKKTSYILQDKEKYEILVGRGNTKDAIQARLKLMMSTYRSLIKE